MFFLILNILWFIVISKNILFWLYLWQLKEYHIGRFLAHFQTENGKKLILNKLSLSKVFLAFIFILIFLFVRRFWDKSSFFPDRLIALAMAAGFFVIYFFESIRTIQNLFQKKLKIPVLTFKTIPLIFICILLEIAVVFLLFQIFPDDYPFFLLGLLLFDIFIPLKISAIVLLFQPLAVLRKKQIIRKAIKKRGEFKNLLVIGITGSYGKTSTKEFLAAILSQKFNVLKTKEHQNSEIGISQCILDELRPEHQIFIVEMGAYNRGGIKLLCDISQPRMGILTGINEQHLATFGSLENIIKTKFELIKNLPKDGTAILNGDNKYIIGFKSQTATLGPGSQIFYSTEEKMNIWAEDIVVNKKSMSFRIFSKQSDFADFWVNVLGKHNAANILAAVAAAKELGMDLREIAKAAGKIESRQGGMILRKNSLGLNIVDSTYSANPDGVISDLEYLKVWPGKKTIIMSCLIELGSASKDAHKRIGEKIAEVCQLAIITTKDSFKEIKEGAIGKGMKPENIIFSENPKEIMERVKDFNGENDILLLEGRISKEIIERLIK